MKIGPVVCVVVFAASCGKKADKPAPALEQKIVEKAPDKLEVPAPLPVTSKSPEAVAEYQKGRDIAMHARGPEALEHFKKALALDPDFADAMALAGIMTPGADGTDMLAKAATLAAKLPEAERSFIEAYQAMRAGDEAKEKQRFMRASELAPADWMLQVIIAENANVRGDDATAIKYSEKALATNPDAAVAHNILAYSYANQRQWDKAIAEAKKQVELLPKEPNPMDTLGEIEMWSGKFDDADKSFVEAAKADPQFWTAWNGAALARAYKGDYKGAYAAFDEQKKSTVPGMKLAPMLDSAWIQFAENKLPQALSTLDALDKEPDASKYATYAYSALDRGNMLQLSGKYADAAKWYATALSRADALPGDAKVQVTIGYRVGMLRNAAMQGKPAADGDKMIADEEARTKDLADDKLVQSLLARMRGLAAWAKGGAKDGPKAAIVELSKCDPNMLMCRYDLALATRRAGDAAGADAIDKQLAETPRRMPEGVYIKTHPTKSAK